MAGLIFYIFIFSVLSNVLESKKLTCDLCSTDEPEIFSEYIEFYLCKNSSSECQLIDYSDKLKEFLQKQQFDTTQNTAVIIHGFLDNHMTSWVQQMKENFLALDPKMNVILVEWKGIYSLLYYKNAALGTETVAKKLVKILKDMADASHELANWKHLHFIGHSLGAHVAGQAARILKDETLLDVHRVTALDPAKPCFNNNSSSLRLRKEDAKFVDVIHTTINDNDDNFGIFEPIGHLDFYAIDDNIRQTRIELIDWISCRFTGIRGMSKFVNRHVVEQISNHQAAHKYFLESLNGTAYWSSQESFPIIVTNESKRQNKECTRDTCIEMGINAEKYRNKSNSGMVYYVDINKNYIDMSEEEELLQYDQSTISFLQ